MARIPDAPPRGLIARLIYFFTRRRVGKVVAPMRVTGHHPTLLLGYGMMEQQLSKSRLVPARAKALAQLRAATRIGCPF